jgi:exosortase
MTDTTTEKDASASRRPALVDLVGESEPAAIATGSGSSAPLIVKIAVLAGLLVTLNYWQFVLMVSAWCHDVNWSHGFLIPLFGIYLLYARRKELSEATRRGCWWGLPIMILSIVMIVLGIYPIQNSYLSQLSMIPLALGLVLFVGGWEITRLTWLPIAFFVFAMPIPDQLYSRIAEPLQGVAARGSVFILQFFGATVQLAGSSHIELISVSGAPRQLDVVEACSGVRSLLSFVALGVAWAYLQNRPVWQRVVLVASTIPVAILCNVIRVTVTGTMFVLDHSEFGSDFLHEFTGLVMLAPALLMLWLLSKLLESIFVEVDEDEEGGKPAEEAAGS